ncbi:hypothetical protein H4R19_002182 [Coemansia spiralis]|nr:hypothetical protein H4R19_002182 [Coemansia spiralis]
MVDGSLVLAPDMLATNIAINTGYSGNEPTPPTQKKLWGLGFSPYNDDGSCADLGKVTSQLEAVAKIASNIRLYATDCSQLANAMQAISNSGLSLGVHAGIWASSGPDRVNAELDQFVAAAKKYDRALIKGLSVGNEALRNGVSVDQLIGHIQNVRARLKAEGLGGIPVYTTEVDTAFTPALVDACDLLQINLQVVFGSAFTSTSASAHEVISRADAFKSKFARGKSVQIGEAGWPSAGKLGPFPLTLDNQKGFARAFKCLVDKTDYNYFYFEAKDALWKSGQSLPEQSFGVFSAGFTPKFDFGLFNSC